MKLILFIAFVLFFSYGQADKKPTSAKAATLFVKKNDTDFISRKFYKHSYQKVFIEKNRNSKEYKSLLEIKMDDDDGSLYVNNLAGLTHIYHNFKSFINEDFPKNWLPLNNYKNRLYIYFPSERGESGRISLTDSTLIKWSIEGPSPQAILMVKQLNKVTWKITSKYFYNGWKAKRVIVHIIDEKSKMAVWEYLGEKGINQYNLCIPFEHAKEFDMVVTSCLQNRTNEFVFGKIDYKALLKKVSK